MSASSGQPSPGSRAWETPADSRVMQALVSRCWRADWPTQHLHAGDVDWWSVHAFGRTPGLEGRVRLWFAGEPDATELVGFAWYGLPNEADLIVAPAHRGPAVIGAMIDWVEAQIPRYGSTPATRLGGLDVDAVETPAQVDPANDTPAPADGPAMTARVWSVVEDEAAVRALAELGFEEGSEPGFAHFTGRIDALDLSAPVLPDGYELGTIDTDADVAARVACGIAAFPGSTMTVEKYAFCRSTPFYRPALDTIVRGPDGTVAAFALAWLDPLTGGVELEPVGVHPDHHRRGLGRAVCRAALRTAGSVGGSEALIGAERMNPAADGPVWLARARGHRPGRGLPSGGGQRLSVASPTRTPIVHRTTKIGNPPGTNWSTVWTSPVNAPLTASRAFWNRLPMDCPMSPAKPVMAAVSAGRQDGPVGVVRGRVARGARRRRN